MHRMTVGPAKRPDESTGGRAAVLRIPTASLRILLRPLLTPIPAFPTSRAFATSQSHASSWRTAKGVVSP